MASCTSPSSFMFARGASSVHPEDITSSLCFLNPKSLFGTSSLVSKPRVRDTSNWVSVNLQKEAMSRSYHPLVATRSSDNEAAQPAENDDEDKEKKEEGVNVEGSDAALRRPRFNKRKAKLPPRREKAVIFCLACENKTLFPFQYGRNVRPMMLFFLHLQLYGRARGRQTRKDKT